MTGLLDPGVLCVVNVAPFLLRADEISVYVVLPQKLIPVPAVSVLCLEDAI